MLHPTLAPPPDSVYMPIVWTIIANIAVPLVLIGLTWLLVWGIGWERRHQLSQTVTYEAWSARHSIDPEPSIGSVRCWLGTALTFAVLVAAVSFAVTYHWSTTTPYGAWQAEASKWAQHTYGAVVVDDPFQDTDSCKVPSTDPCEETAVRLNGQLIRAQIAYPSGIATLIDANSGQPFPKIGTAK